MNKSKILKLIDIYVLSNKKSYLCSGGVIFSLNISTICFGTKKTFDFI